MFGKNQIVGKKYFENAGDKIFITSVFMTLQGEGPFRGMPAVFVRFTKCNLSCGFCDTWFDSGDWLSLTELENKIHNAVKSAYAPNNIPDWLLDDNNKLNCGLVITGGEPMLQQNITNVLEYFNDKFNWLQIESNGTLLQNLTQKTTLVCSPKCSEKNGKPLKYLTPKEEILERANCLKFVMSAEQDSPYSSIPEWALNWKKITGKSIFISPMNIYNEEPEQAKSKKATTDLVSLEERSAVDEVISFWSPGLLNMSQNQKNHEYAAKYCLEHGCIFQVQIHLLASLA